MIPAVDRKRFFIAYRARWGRLTQSQVAGLEFLLGELERDPNITGIPQASYALATTKHESADTWQPIEEYGKGRGRKYGRPVEVTDAEGHKRTVTFFGRGYVQLTWQRNYETFAKLLDLDLVGHPELALEPETAYRVMSVGMAEGLFTGKKLGDYVNAHRRDFRNARRVINGTDRADHIAALAEDFLEILTEATETAPHPGGAQAAGAFPAPADAADAGGAVLGAVAPPAEAAPAPVVVEQAQTVVAEAPAPVVPQTEAVQASTGGVKSWIATVASGVTFSGAGVIAFLKDNVNGVFWAGLFLFLIVALFLFRQIILDWLRVKVAADPTKHNAV